MALGYRIDVLDDLPVVIVKITFPPRLDVEHMFAEIARDIQPRLGDATSLTYRINDLSLFNHINIATHVIRGMVNEVRGWPGTNSDSRIFSIMAGKGANVQLLVENLRSEQYGGWNIQAFDTVEQALIQIRKWESGEEARPPVRIVREPGDGAQHTVL